MQVGRVAMDSTAVTRRLLLLLVLLATAVLRWSGLGWDSYLHYHPDERYISWVATTIEWPYSLATAFDPHTSSFNPYYWPADGASEGIVVPQDEPRDFAYGHVPLYLGVAATRLMEAARPLLSRVLPDSWAFTREVLNTADQIEFRHVTAVSRWLTGLFDVGTVLLVYLLGKQLFSRDVGLLAAAFLAVNVMHIQLAHFFISDPYQTFFGVAALLCLVTAVNRVRAGGNGRWLLGLAAASVGLAVGSKFSAILLLLPLGLAVWALWPGAWGRWLLALVGITAVTFFLTNPFAVLDFSCEVITPRLRLGPLTMSAIDWRSCYLENITTQSDMVRGDLDAAFTRQYSGTLPFLYPVEMQLRWGMGPLLGLLAFAGFGWALWQVTPPLAGWSRRLWISSVDELAARWAELRQMVQKRPLLLIFVWVVPFFVTTASFFVKFMRYLQPLTPFLMIFAAALVWRQRPWRRWGVAAATLLLTGLYAWRFVAMYQQPHPWLTASQWIYQNVPSGALILSEQWDDSLPSSLLLDGEDRRRSEYENAELTWLTGTEALDDGIKLQQNVALLAEADYLTLTSNRIYSVVPRLPQRYPLSSQYHPLLFSGALGYELVFVTDRTPTLAGRALQSDTFGWVGLMPPTAVADYLAAKRAFDWGRADESFTVYDQPLTMIFRNTGRLTPAEMMGLFNEQ